MSYSSAEIIRLIDLTSLNDDDTPERIAALCGQARAAGGVAAVCVYPSFIAQAMRELPDTPIATVINFPAGKDSDAKILADTASALAAGAKEIDLVLPQENAQAIAAAVKRQCRQAQSLLKIIIESGRFAQQADIAAAAGTAIDSGADFVKTSTGKIPVGATPEAVDTICRTIAAKNAAARVGIKISGGVRTPEDARRYLAIIEGHFGRSWIAPARVRIGASALLAALQ